MNRHVRIYRRLLRLYPADFRIRYANEMITLFREQLWDARASGERRQIALLWVRCVLDVVLTAPKEHFDKERRASELVDGSSVVLVKEARPASLSVPRLLAALLPLWVFVIEATAVPNAFEPIFANPPAMLGLPLGLLLLALGLMVMAVGAAIMSRTTSTRSAIYAFLFLTAPSTALIILAPALILFIISLTPQTGAKP
jgi:hypothetical protein